MAPHRLAIIRRLLELPVSASYVDDRRDARGWAFREPTGPDPVNNATLLREVYELAEPGYDGPVTVPVLWDVRAATIRSNSPVGIGVDLATAFGDDSLRPGPLVPRIDAMSQRIAADVESQLGCAVYRPAAAETLRLTLADLDGVLAARERLVDDRLTDADIRLWVQLVRYDAGPNAHGAIGPRLDAFPHLWRWARALWALPAFRSTTDLTRIAAPMADLPPWD